MSDRTENHDPLFTRKQAARYLGDYSPQTLEVWASRQRGPAFIKFGPNGRVRYRKSALDAYLNQQLVRNGKVKP